MIWRVRLDQGLALVRLPVDLLVGEVGQQAGLLSVELVDQVLEVQADLPVARPIMEADLHPLGAKQVVITKHLINNMSCREQGHGHQARQVSLEADQGVQVVLLGQKKM